MKIIFILALHKHVFKRVYRNEVIFYPVRLKMVSETA